jgi:hypothetical protein
LAAILARIVVARLLPLITCHAQIALLAVALFRVREWFFQSFLINFIKQSRELTLKPLPVSSH